MEIRLQTGNSFSVPVTVADHFLKLATHDQLKILLYVLCHAEKPLAAEEIMRACSVTQSAVEEALVFWQNVNVLTNSAPAEPVTVHVQTATAPVQQSVQPVQTETTPAPAAEKPAPRAEAPVSSGSFRLLPADVAARKEADPAVADMLTCIEQCAGRLLNFTEVKSFLWMHEYLGLQPDVIVMLAAYCAEVQKFQVRTMEAIAVAWQENGIVTHALAQADIQQRTERRSYIGQMMHIFGMSKAPTAAQTEVFEKWRALRMPPEMVRIAYDKMRDNTSMEASSRQQLKYMNGIIERWAAAGIFTPAAAAKEDADHRAAMQRDQQKGQPPQKRRTSQPQKPSAQTAQSSINLADAEKLINKKL